MLQQSNWQRIRNMMMICALISGCGEFSIGLVYNHYLMLPFSRNMTSLTTTWRLFQPILPLGPRLVGTEPPSWPNVTLYTTARLMPCYSRFTATSGSHSVVFKLGGDMCSDAQAYPMRACDVPSGLIRSLPYHFDHPPSPGPVGLVVCRPFILHRSSTGVILRCLYHPLDPCYGPNVITSSHRLIVHY